MGEQIIQEARQVLQVGDDSGKANKARRLQSGQVRVASVRSIANEHSAKKSSPSFVVSQRLAL